MLFSYASPRDLAPYQSFFGAPIRFDADENALVFPDRWLRQPIPSADAKQYSRTMERMKRVEREMGIDVVERARSILPSLIASQLCSQERLAHLLSLHPRTFDRRLKASGTTFLQVVTEARYSMSKQLLMYSDMSIIRISNLLGYSDSSVFTRAFRRWSGVSPSVWRMHNKQLSY